MTLDWIFGWWNLVFIAPFFLALVYLGVYAASGVTFGDVDHDADLDADADADADVDHDIDADADADMDHDVDADADADQDVDDADHTSHAAGGSSIAAALTWLGIGRVPVSIVLTVLFLSWGFIGFSSNQILRERIADPNCIALISIAIALIGSALATRLISLTVAKYVPIHETYAHARHELLGNVGEVVLNIDDKFGLVAVRDESGQFMQVPARARTRDETIPKGTRVRLVAYTAKDRFFHVIREREPSGSAAGSSTAVTKTT